MKSPQRFLRDQLVLAQHHINDAESATNRATLQSSLSDTEDMIQRMGSVLPARDRVSVKAEKYRKEAGLADSAHPRTVAPKDISMSFADLLKKAHEAEIIDRANAFDIGFARAAHDAGLDESQYQAMRKIAMDKLSADMKNEAQPATNEKMGPEAPQQEKHEKSVKKVKDTPSAIAGSGRGCK